MIENGSLSERILSSRPVESFMRWVLIGMIALLPVCVLAWVIWGVHLAFAPAPETFSLRFDQWTCTAQKEVIRQRMVGVVGKGGHYVPEVRIVCTQYTEKQ